jgi:excisionase family DNA binding protein
MAQLHRYLDVSERRGITRAEAATLLRKSEKSIDRMIRAGQLPSSKVGRSVLISARAVEQLLPK